MKPFKTNFYMSLVSAVMVFVLSLATGTFVLFHSIRGWAAAFGFSLVQTKPPLLFFTFQECLNIFYIYTFFLHGLLHASHSRNPARTSEIARLRLPFFLSARTCPELHVSFTCKHDMPHVFRHCKKNYNSQLFTVLGNGITSRIFPIPVRYITQRSNPRPNPACLAEPYFLRSR